MIRYYEYARWVKVRNANANALVVFSNGQVSCWHDVATWGRGTRPEFICDTADEAERMRLLIEKRREELEAVERKYELLIAAEVER